MTATGKRIGVAHDQNQFLRPERFEGIIFREVDVVAVQHSDVQIACKEQLPELSRIANAQPQFDGWVSGTNRSYEAGELTKVQARRDVIGYIEGFYNSRRRHSALDYKYPNDVHYSYTQSTTAA